MQEQTITREFGIRGLGIPDVVAARASHECGRDAKGEVQTFQARIAAATPAIEAA